MDGDRVGGWKCLLATALGGSNPFATGLRPSTCDLHYIQKALGQFLVFFHGEDFGVDCVMPVISQFPKVVALYSPPVTVVRCGKLAHRRYQCEQYSL